MKPVLFVGVVVKSWSLCALRRVISRNGAASLIILLGIVPPLVIGIEGTPLDEGGVSTCSVPLDDDVRVSKCRAPATPFILCLNSSDKLDMVGPGDPFQISVSLKGLGEDVFRTASSVGKNGGGFEPCRLLLSVPVLPVT